MSTLESFSGAKTVERIPFAVTAVLVTEENMHDIAALLDAKAIESSEGPAWRTSRKMTGRSRIIKPGVWVTSYAAVNNTRYRVFSADAFKSYFREAPAITA